MATKTRKIEHKVILKITKETSGRTMSAPQIRKWLMELLNGSDYGKIEITLVDTFED